MLKRIAIVLIASLMGLGAAGPIHNNKTEYAGLSTGMPFGHFNSVAPGFKEVAKGNFWEVEHRSKNDFVLQVRRPPDMELFDRYLKKVPIRVLKPTGELVCDSPVGASFLSLPVKKDGKKKERLFSYDYLACAGTDEISPSRLMEKYLEKYGTYDGTDYDRDQHIYSKVKSRYEVRVKFFAVASGEPGLIITVTDESVFKDTYDAWRGWLRNLEESVKRKF